MVERELPKLLVWVRFPSPAFNLISRVDTVQWQGINMRISHYLTFLLLIFTHFTYAAELNDASVKVKWGYIGNIGPERWAALSPAFSLCATGKAQSPINIIKKVTTVPFDLTIRYHAAPLDIVTDGETSLKMNQTDVMLETGHGVQVNFAPDANEALVFNQATYRLIQFHIHSPSENQWRGRSFPLEIHFVHQGEDGKVLVLGVFVKGGHENPSLQAIIKNLPAKHGEVVHVPSVNIDPEALLPSARDYYHFMGSLTTPPCLEGVTWLVMPAPIEASPAQFVTLRKAAGGANARLPQPLHHRPISFSSQS